MARPLLAPTTMHSLPAAMSALQLWTVSLWNHKPNSFLSDSLLLEFYHSNKKVRRTETESREAEQSRGDGLMGD